METYFPYYWRIYYMFCVYVYLFLSSTVIFKLCCQEGSRNFWCLFGTTKQLKRECGDIALCYESTTVPATVIRAEFTYHWYNLGRVSLGYL